MVSVLEDFIQTPMKNFYKFCLDLAMIKINAFFIAILVITALPSCATSTADAKKSNEERRFSVLILSRGAGVPTETREVFNEIKRLLINARTTGAAVNVTENRIGLEGETKLCVTSTDPLALEDLVGKVKALSKGVELMNIDAESCGNSQ